MKYVFFVCCTIIIVGCVDVSKPYIEKQFFLVEVNRDETKAPNLKNILRVSDFIVSPGFTDREMVYLKADNQYTSDFYNSFFISVSNMLTEQSKNWLQQSGLFAQVVTLSSSLDPNYILEGSVQSIYGDFRDTKNPKAVLKIQLLLLGLSEEGQSAILYQKNFDQQEQIKSTEADELVKGWNKALAAILRQLENDIKSILK